MKLILGSVIILYNFNESILALPSQLSTDSLLLIEKLLPKSDYPAVFQQPLSAFDEHDGHVEDIESSAHGLIIKVFVPDYCRAQQ